MTARPKETIRLWLTYPPKLIRRPAIYELGHKFAVVTDILQASVTEDQGILSLELKGDCAEIKRAIGWLRRIGVKVEEAKVRVTRTAGRSAGLARAI